MSEAKPLSISLPTSTTKTSLPMIRDGSVVKVSYQGAKQKTIEGKGDIIEHEFHLVEPAQSTDGEVINPGKLGSKLFHPIFLFGGEDPMTRATRSTNRILDALLGTGDPGSSKPSRPEFNESLVNQMKGATCYVNVKVPTREGAMGNEISSFRHESEISAGGQSA